MQKLMTYETLRYFSYSNDKICVAPIKGIVIDFFGLGCQDMYHEDTPFGKELAGKGIILVIPYNNPWAWMNEQSVHYTDEIISILMDHYTLPESVPIVSSGGSMGGLSALVYTTYTKRTPVACAANCPVCDLVYHYTERPDLPRTLYSAFFQNKEDCLEDALKTASPIHLINNMPKIDYYIFHCENDTAVNQEKHSDQFVSMMKKTHHVTYHTIPGREHCDLPDDIWKIYSEYIINAILNKS